METVKVTLYEISGYILPGIITLLSLIVIFTNLNNGIFYIHESTFTIGFVIVSSYFLGHLNQAIANFISTKCEHQFIENRDSDINRILLKHEINPTDSNAKSFKIIMNLAMSKKYRTSEMDTYIEREGFYRGSLIGFGLLAAAFVVSIFFTDFKLSSKEYVLVLGFWQKMVIVWLSTTCSLLFFRRYMRFLEYRINVMIDTINAVVINESSLPY